MANRWQHNSIGGNEQTDARAVWDGRSRSETASVHGWRAMKEARRPYGPEMDRYAERGVSGATERCPGGDLPCIDGEQVSGLSSDLQRVVEGEIIPRLMLLEAHNRKCEERVRTAASGAAGQQVSAAPIPEENIAEFAQLILAQDAEIAVLYIEALSEQGLGIDRLFADLLAPAARRLGILWEEDQIDFVDVTVGMSLLHEIVHRYRPSYSFDFPDRTKRILLQPAPGEQHTFGLLLVSDYFMKRGWDVRGGYPLDPLEIDDIISSQRWDVLAFSIANTRLVDDLCAEIGRARKLSRNTDVQVLIGGNAVAEDPELARKIGADLIASSPAEAFAVCEASCDAGRNNLN